MYSLTKNKTWIYQEENFLTEEENKNVMDLGNFQNLELGGLGAGKINESVRNSFISWINIDEKSQWLYTKVSDKINQVNNNHYNFELFDFEVFQFAGYFEHNQGRYGPHSDSSGLSNPMRKLSIIILLSDDSDFEGGELCFYVNGSSYVFKNVKNSFIAFPSFLIHQVTPVTKGSRYSLVSWVRGPQFK
ncbi:2OG-Fe(II) oxygenase [bacterium]|nr:2OG-Fe(II) oxygenase [bacterium]